MYIGDARAELEIFEKTKLLGAIHFFYSKGDAFYIFSSSTS